MKKVLALIVLLVLIYAIVNRHRLFVRDPFATLTRDGVKEDGAQVFINFSSDAIIENENPPAYMTILQQGTPIGTPHTSFCMRYLLCMTDADHATLSIESPGAAIDSMSGKQITFHSDKGGASVVTLH